MTGVLAAVLSVAAPGLAPAQPLQLPGALAPSAPGQQQAPAPTAGGSGAGATPSGPPRPRVIPAVASAGLDQVLGRALKRNGSGGSATLVKLGDGHGLKLAVDGFQIDNLTEPCAVNFGEEPVKLTALGRPAGALRYRLEAPICPMVFDVLNGALFAVEPAQPCVIEAAACRIEVKGLWGPEGNSLLPQANDLQRARVQAESAVRESYRTLVERANRQDQRLVAREQAGFSSERELACRDYAREPVHGFCHARFTEARAGELRLRLGGAAEPAAPKPRPPRPRPTAPPLGISPPPAAIQ